MKNNKFLLSQVHIYNFRGYREKSFDLFSDKETKDLKDGIILISGPNGFGKTTLLDAIEWCLTGTVRRLEYEYLSRKETSKSLQAGLIKNSLSKRGEIVKVKVEACFNGKNVELIRTFSESTERLGFSPSGTEFKFIIDDKEYDGDTIDDLLSIEIDQEVQVSKYFYDRHICTFDKNLKLYSNSREDFYRSFSLFFGGTDEIESILNNLDGFEEKQGRTKKLTTGLLEELNNKIINERELLEKHNQTLIQEKDNFNELKKNIALASNLDLELRKYPNELIFPDEKRADHYYFSEDKITHKYTLCKGQRERFEQLQRVLLAKSVEKYIVMELGRCSASEDLSNFRKRVKETYEANSNLIQLIQNKDLKQYKDKKLALDSEILKVEHVKQFNSESQIFFEQLKSNYEFEKRIIELLSTLSGKLSQKEECISQIKEFETNEQTTNALRAIVDHISGFEEIRHSGQEKCPLCGSIEFFRDQGIELATEAKRLLGTVDNARSVLVNALSATEGDITKLYTELKETVLTALTNLRVDVAAVLKTFSELELFILELNKFDLILSELTIEKISEVENRLLLQVELKLDKGSNDFPENEIKYVYSFFPNKTKETYWEIYDQLSDSQKVEIFKDFIQLSKLYTEDFFNTNQLLVPISDISMDIVNSKVVTLRKVENELKNDELLKAAEKKVRDLDAKYHALNNELIAREKKLAKLKELQRELREIRNSWDKRVVEQINEPMQRIFKRLSRHTNIDTINLISEGITTQKTNVTVTVDGGKEMYVPNVLSAGQLSMVSLSMFLTVAMGQKRNPFRCYFLDDPIQSMDDLNVLSFVDLLRVEQNEKDRFFDQLFITTCNEDLEKLIAHKMKTFNVNLCHLHFDGYGEFRNI
ncbi:AAA family ATPase [Paenibacillus anseongense]|uniref:AAA family ATPase n=1 Tax=Paenibacillus anseongense TaxID=2682845 RepID=UPI002DB8A10D|nr:AAA family ATPase [Paenibacillus anseongense]MEC0269693.1 AAA family ATPase [Paenibacillus anseongense]